MPEIFKRKIYKVLKHRDYRPLRLGQLAKVLGVGSDDYPQFKEAFDQLRQVGHVVIGAGNLVTLPPMAGLITGTFRANPKGFGFVVPLDTTCHGDLFIPPGATAEAMTGDIVAAKVVKRGRRGPEMRLSGKIVEILERACNRLVGTLLKGSHGWSVQPDGTGFVEPISVDDVTAKNAAHKDKVVVEILTWPREQCLARGVITEVLGKAGTYESEISSIIHQYHLPTEFDDDCIAQARKAAAEFDPDKTNDRDDITEKLIITIDPPDAKDFDDAISLEKDSDGNWILGVHITDVSCFVKPDSALDADARLRGNSIYLPGRTIPMLPEILSNGICSLQPGQKRFCKSVYLTYGPQGNVISRSLANSVCCSTQRLTYEQADKALKGRAKGVKPEVIELLKDMETLSHAIESRRFENGMLHLDLPETELIMDKSGRVVDARPADDSYPHTMIEMFMVEANEAVATLLDKLDVPIMRRIHPEPDPLSMKNLAKLIRALGLSLPRDPERSDIRNLLEAVRDADCAFAVNLVVLRSLEKAQYAPLKIGHYALASSQYCHFTSPIRRYADLLIHRVLQSYLDHAADSKLSKISLGDADTSEIGKHITFTEQRATDAERELNTVLILQLLSRHIGDEFDGVVTGLATFGVFVQSRKFGVEALIRMAELGDDKWKFNPKTQSIVALRSGCSIRLGRPMKVRITGVNVPARQLNAVPAEPLTGAPASKTKTKTRKTSRNRSTQKRSRAKR